jgi:long-chain acyl-CoA synthetase
MNYKTIPEAFIKVCDKYGDKKPAYMFKRDGKYVGLTYSSLRESVESFAAGLINLGIEKGDRVGIVSENRIEWIVSDFAITAIGAVDVPIFPTHTAKQEEYIFNNCDTKAIVVSNNYQLKKLLEVRENIPSLKHIIVMNKDFSSDDPSIISMSDVISTGNITIPAEERRKKLIELATSVKPDDLLTLIYTSGTTGNPKGVMLTNDNIISNINGIEITELITEHDLLLSYLPFCHAYERSTGYYTAFCIGSTVALAETIETVGANIVEVKPTMMTTVPRLLEVIKRKIFANIEKESKAKRKIFYWAMDIAKKFLDAKEKNIITIPLKTKYQIADRLVFSKIRQKTGGRLQKFFSGGAALPEDVCRFFLGVGLTVIEGYGLTEASPVVTVNSFNNLEPGSIGLPLPGVEVKIAQDGEILARGRNIMKGYWNDPQATAETIDSNGWLYTGDIGIFTEKGNIKITDRKKNIIVSSGGKNIAPQPIENILSQSLYIEHVLLVGDRREYITALITPDYEQLKKLADDLDIKYDKETELITNDKVIGVIKRDIDKLQQDHAKYERVRKFKLISQPFSVENGELTPKLSIRRHVVESKYSDFIDEMYSN